ncbi:MAG TPA: sigma-54 dependent transcriptional regulator [Balneolaceae bacterium]|nr:sigma-54 dependent transcriptional regulator [Balneolaceae bacterium]
MKPISILVADDEPSMRLNLSEILEAEGYSVLEAETGHQAIEHSLRYHPRVILMDIKMPQMSGLKALRILNKQVPDTPVIIFTAFGTSEHPIEAMKSGAFDYLEKPFDIDELTSLIRRAVLFRESAVKPGSTIPDSPRGFNSAEEFIIGSSKKMRELLKMIGKIAPSETSVLIEGESGTGKELIADAIYRHSKRANGPFIKINCGALPDSLLESELFGHEKGAFTGAIRQRKGRFELADGGTLFLDEVDALTLPMQIKLLRVLQNFTFERVGGEKTLHTNARILAATNKNLSSKVKEGSFREDLFYRLNVIHLPIPPLRERMEDIRDLTMFFLKKFSQQRRLTISEDALLLLQKYHWPGNIRELENVIQRAVVLAPGSTLTQKDISITLNTERASWQFTMADRSTIPFHSIIENVEKDLILRALNQTQWNKTAAAKLLSINRRLLYSKMDQHGIEYRNS